MLITQSNMLIILDIMVIPAKSPMYFDCPDFDREFFRGNDMERHRVVA